jgi:diguanylate cyclase (GGDEF)-like protein
MKIQHTFTLLIIPLIVTPLLLLGWNAYQHLYNSSQTKAFASVNGALDQLAHVFNREIVQAKANLDLLATDITVIQYALTEDELSRYSIYQRGVLERFKNYQQAFPQYQEIRFLLTDGYEDAYWANESVNNQSDEESESHWFQSMVRSEEPYFFTVINSPDTGTQVMYLFKALHIANQAISKENNKPRLRGYLGLTLSFTHLEQQLHDIALINDLFITALKTPAPDTNTEKPNSNAATAIITSKALTPTELQQLGKLQPLHTNHQGRIFELTLDTGLHYAGSRNIADRLTLLGAVPASTISLLSQRLSTSIFVITLSAILLTVFMIIFFLRRVIVSPLDKLAIASQKIGEGKLDTHINIKGSDEIQALANSFNRMSTHLEESNEKIRFIAYHDSLTKLPNRRMFQYYLHNALATANRTQDQLALFFLDVDNFKTINDSLGHDMGDELLKLVATRINQALRDEDFLGEPDATPNGDLVARLGGDEFTVILPRINEPISASIVAKRILDNMAESFIVRDQVFHITLSIGITIYPDDGSNADKLLKCADIAMYHAKSEGKNNYQFYTSDLNTEISHRIERENELREAIKNGQIFLHYQPQIDLQSHEIYGIEALVRWQHPEKGVIPPYKFISLAEETGMILDIGNFVLNESCRQAMEWRKQGLPDLNISVNFSSVQFSRQNVEQLIEDALESTGLPPRLLTAELTETSLMQAKQETLEALEKIRQLGVTIALDDFGTGYSSLSYLRTFPVDTLKIDRSFIVEAEHNQDVKEIIKAIIQMAQAMQLKVVAEGVEEVEQLVFLSSIECDIIQGYFFSTPLPADELKEFVLGWPKTAANTLPPNVQSLSS